MWQRNARLIAGAQPDPRRDATRHRHRDRILVGRDDLRRDARPSEALRGEARSGRHRLAARQVVGELEHRACECVGVAGRHEHAFDTVVDDAGVAGDVRGDHRHPGGESLGQHHAEALAPERRSQQQVGFAQQRELARVADLPVRAQPRRIQQQRLDVGLGRADEVNLDRGVVAQRLERAQGNR